MSAPEPASPLAHALAPGRHGAAGGEPVTIAERAVAIVQVTARRGREAEVAAALERTTGLVLPGPCRAALAGDLAAVWIQPASWLVVAPRATEGGLAATLRDAAGEAAAVVDQSHGKAVLRLSGGRARDVLAKGCRVDLHPRAFTVGSAATTPIDHVNATIVQVDEAPTYDLVLPATLAESVLDWLTASAAEHGYQVGP